MKKHLLFSLVFCYSIISGQIKTPQPSPTATITQKIGVSNVSVEYSRPGAKGREIFGGLVKYGELWRTGANKATKITFEEDVVFGGQKIKKGSYSLFTVPSEKTWKILLNTETEIWGTGNYDEAKEVCKLKVDVIESPKFIESFTIDFGEFKDFSAIMSLKWANVVVDIEIKSLSAKQNIIDDYLQLLSKGPSANDYYNGAKFFANNSELKELALEWINIAIDKKPEAFWMVYHKARIQNILGMKQEAIKTANMVIDLASEKKDDYGYIQKSKDLIADLSSKKKK